MQWITRLREVFEPRAFGVCSWLGEHIGIPTRHIRLFFVYTAFIANWSPLIIYLALAFVINIRNYVRENLQSYRDL